jgi:hypothetical protein
MSSHADATKKREDVLIKAGRLFGGVGFFISKEESRSRKNVATLFRNSVETF